MPFARLSLMLILRVVEMRLAPGKVSITQLGTLPLWDWCQTVYRGALDEPMWLMRLQGWCADTMFGYN